MHPTFAAFAVWLTVAAAYLMDKGEENKIDIFLPKSTLKTEPSVDRAVRAFYYNYWLYPGMALRNGGPYASSPFAELNYAEPLTFQDVFEKPVLVVTPSQNAKNTFSTFYLHNGLRTLYRYHAFSWLQEFFKQPSLKGLIFYPHLIYNVRFFETPISSFILQDDIRMSDFIGADNCNGKIPYMFVAPEDVFERMHFENIAKVSDFKVYNDSIEVHPIFTSSRPVYEPFYGSQSPQQHHAPPACSGEAAVNSMDFRSNEEGFPEDAELPVPANLGRRIESPIGYGLGEQYAFRNNRVIDSQVNMNYEVPLHLNSRGMARDVQFLGDNYFQVAPQANPSYGAGRNIVGSRGNAALSGVISRNQNYYQNQDAVPLISRGNIAISGLEFEQGNPQQIDDQAVEISTQKQIMRSDPVLQYTGSRGNIVSQVREPVGIQGGAVSGIQAGTFSRVGSSGLVSDHQQVGQSQAQSTGFSSAQSGTLVRTEGVQGGMGVTVLGLGSQTLVQSSGSSNIESGNLVRSQGLNVGQIGGPFGVQGGTHGNTELGSQTQVQSSGSSRLESRNLVRTEGLNDGQIGGSIGVQGGVHGNAGLGSQTQVQTSGSSNIESGNLVRSQDLNVGQIGGSFGVQRGTHGNVGLGSQTQVQSSGSSRLESGNLVRTEGLNDGQIRGSIGVQGGVHGNVGLGSQTQVQSSGSSNIESGNLVRTEGLNDGHNGGSFGVQGRIHANVGLSSQTQVESSGSSSMETGTWRTESTKVEGQSGGHFGVEGGIGAEVGLGNVGGGFGLSGNLDAGILKPSGLLRNVVKSVVQTSTEVVKTSVGAARNVAGGVLETSAEVAEHDVDGLLKTISGAVESTGSILRTGDGAVENVTGGFLRTSTGAVRAVANSISGQSVGSQSASSSNVETSTLTGSQRLV